jgi:hypothetical protein
VYGPRARESGRVNSRVDAGLSQMKNSKKGLSKLSTIDAGFAERTGVLQSLRTQFPKIIEEMIQLLITANEDCENHLHQFAFDLDGIAYLYGRRLNSPFKVFRPPPEIETHPNYIANQHARLEKLETAVQVLTGLKSDLGQLDADHLKKFISSYRTPTGRTKYSGPLDLFFEIELATVIIAACQVAYSSTFRVRARKKGRPPLPYVEATRQLITLWEKYTGKKVPSSKTHKGQITTNAGEFIRLGISLIDPNVTDAKVVTSINNALSQSS